MFVPKRMFLAKGVGMHKEKLTSFEMALRDADIAEFNLVSVKSIFPPNCKVISRRQGLKELSAGQIVFWVTCDQSTNEPNRLIAASVGVAIPSDPSRHGYLSEHHSFGERDEVAGDYAEDLAATMLATTLGVDFNPDTSYDERKEVWRISGQIVRTRHITQTAVGNKKGMWTTVVAGAILLP